jgi:Rps23 Pro-64 3,4-dihydroxylase Tpa1-like proline 4-hydroxylase
MEHEVLAPGIILFKNIIPDYTALIEEIETVASSPSKVIRWKRALVGTSSSGAAKSADRSNYSVGLSSGWSSSENQELAAGGRLAEKLIKSMNTCYMEYRKIYPNVNSGKVPSEAIILKYETGQEYKMHADAGGHNQRVLSLVWYINDDYTGGELEFPFFNYKLKPPANSMIFFPSNYIYAHIAHPVVENVKYAVVSWLLEESHPQ